MTVISLYPPQAVRVKPDKVTPELVDEMLDMLTDVLCRKQFKNFTLDQIKKTLAILMDDISEVE
jgi:hypothetical protein